VADLIESIKMQREMALNPAVPRSRKPGAPSSASQAGDSTATVPDAPPLLWSVVGINGDYNAVLVLGHRVYTVYSALLPQHVGGWKVEHLDGQSLCLSRRDRQLCLPAPDSTSMAYPFLRSFSITSLDGSTEQEQATQAKSLQPAAEPDADALQKALATRLTGLTTSAQEPEK
jgi:hypothetical protein